MTRVRFSTRDCKVCSLKPRCTRSARRLLTPRQRAEHEALVAARAREQDSAFATEQRQRAGIEVTLSRGVRAMGLRRARYVGVAKTRLQRLITAAAINLMRLGAWLGETSAARTRQSAFTRLMYGALACA